jgi:cytochrome b involved in lipid metabolism
MVTHTEPLTTPSPPTSPKGTEKDVKRTYTWSDISKHNSAESCWLVINGSVYDTTEFLSKHPGGDMMLLGAGRHATELFLSHHPSYVVKNSNMLNKYKIGEVEDKQIHLYDTKLQTNFYSTLRERVEKYFMDNKLKPRDNWQMYCKTFIILALWLTFFIKTHSTQNLFIAVLWAILWGFASSLVGTGIMHDANHGGYSNSATVNRLMGAVFDIMGGSSYCWKMIHSIGHHVSTNVRELDPDIHTNEPHFRKIKPTQRHHWWYRYQHIYLPFLYSTLLFELFIRDFIAMALGKWGGVKFQPITKKEWAIFFSCKAFFVVYAFLSQFIISILDIGLELAF